METNKKDLSSLSAEISGISAQLLLMYNALEEGANCSQLSDTSKMNCLFAISEHLDRIVEDLDTLQLTEV